MIYRLQMKNKTVCDVELYHKEGYIELHSSVFVKGYSEVFSIYPTQTTINDFYEIEELRGWLWENYFGGKQNTYTVEHLKNVKKHVVDLLTKIADKYNLYLKED